MKTKRPHPTSRWSPVYLPDSEEEEDKVRENINLTTTSTAKTNTTATTRMSPTGQEYRVGYQDTEPTDIPATGHSHDTRPHTQQTPGHSSMGNIPDHGPNGQTVVYQAPAIPQIWISNQPAPPPPVSAETHHSHVVRNTTPVIPPVHTCCAPIVNSYPPPHEIVHNHPNTVYVDPQQVIDGWGHTSQGYRQPQGGYHGNQAIGSTPLSYCSAATVAHQPVYQESSNHRPYTTTIRPPVYQESINPTPYTTTIRPPVYQESINPTPYNTTIRPPVCQERSNPTPYTTTIRPPVYQESNNPRLYTTTVRPVYQESSNPRLYTTTARPPDPPMYEQLYSQTSSVNLEPNDSDHSLPSTTQPVLPTMPHSSVDVSSSHMVTMAMPTRAPPTNEGPRLFIPVHDHQSRDTDSAPDTRPPVLYTDNSYPQQYQIQTPAPNQQPVDVMSPPGQSMTLSLGQVCSSHPSGQRSRLITTTSTGEEMPLDNAQGQQMSITYGQLPLRSTTPEIVRSSPTRLLSSTPSDLGSTMSYPNSQMSLSIQTPDTSPVEGRVIDCDSPVLRRLSRQKSKTSEPMTLKRKFSKQTHYQCLSCRKSVKVTPQHRKICKKHFTCTKCAIFLRTKEELEGHTCVIDLNNNQPDVTAQFAKLSNCDECGRCSFNYKGRSFHRKEHIQETPGGMWKKFMCVLCHTYYFQKSNYTDHINICHLGNADELITVVEPKEQNCVKSTKDKSEKSSNVHANRASTDTVFPRKGARAMNGMSDTMVEVKQELGPSSDLGVNGQQARYPLTHSPDEQLKLPTSRIFSVKFMCKKCKCPFSTKETLMDHERLGDHVIDTGQQTSRKGCRSLRTVLRPSQKAAPPGENICETCGCLFSSFHQLSRHQADHEQYNRHTGSMKQFHCRLCKTYYKTDSSIRYHLLQFHDRRDGVSMDSEKDSSITTEDRRPLSYMCTTCSSTIFGEQYIMKHILLHEPANRKTGARKPFCCKTCKCYFEVNSAFLDHKKLVHGDNINSDSLDRSLLQPAKKDTPAQNQATSRKRGRKPTAMKTGEAKLVRIQVCNGLKINKTKSVVGKIKKSSGTISETAQVNFVCVLCGQGFRYPVSLRVHQTHHNPFFKGTEVRKPYRCLVCPSFFTSPSKYSKHKTKMHPKQRHM